MFINILTFFTLGLIGVANGASTIPVSAAAKKDLPRCVDEQAHKDLKEIILQLLNQMTSEKIFVSEMQMTYQTGLGRYQKLLLDPEASADRQCFLGLWYGLAAKPSGTASNLILAGWYKNKSLNEQQKLAFKNDLSAIQGPGDPIDFANKTIKKLLETSEGDDL